MIVFPSQWTLHFGEHLVTAYPPGGGRYRYFERLRPTPDFAAIVEKILAGDLAFKVISVGETIKLVTPEGEYGAWVRIHGMRGNAAEQRYIGAVFAEDFAAVLDTWAPKPELFDELAAGSRRFLQTATLGLGLRRRPFLYTPPPGWQCLPSGLLANWYPPDYPRHRTNIVVPPALPITNAPADIIEEHFHGASAGLQITDSTRAPITSETGVTGSYFRLHGTRSGRPEHVFRDVAVFVVEQHVYTFRLETAAAERLPEARAHFSAVAASFRPLPTSYERSTGQAFVAVSKPMDHWAN